MALEQILEEHQTLLFYVQSATIKIYKLMSVRLDLCQERAVPLIPTMFPVYLEEYSDISSQKQKRQLWLEASIK